MLRETWNRTGRRHATTLVVAALLVSALGCASGLGPTPTASPAATASTAAPTTPTTTATPTTSPTPQRELLDLRATRLAIPSLNIDAPVQLSYAVPNTPTAVPGCPAPSREDTLTVPNQGIATPEKAFDGLENKAWIFGHSRWLNQPGLFFGLQDMNVGDEVFVEAIDRGTGATIPRRRFVVDALFLTDLESGGTLVTAEKPEDIPSKPVVILQTSVREDGYGKQWLLNRQKVVAKSRNLVVGDVNDPCKYLLLFVFARSS